MNNSNSQVTQFLDELNHPLRTEIEQLRLIILDAVDGLVENVKWNAPNYSYDGEDRITMKIQPPKQIQLIFHRGAKKLALPEEKLMEDESGLLTWKENDRAIASFKNRKDIEINTATLKDLIEKWIKVSKG